MTTLTYVRLLVFKDIRAMRWPLGLLLLLMVAVMTVLPPNPNDREFSQQTLPFLSVIFIWICAAVFTVQTIQLDPTSREFRFLLTRPVPPAAIGMAKGIFLLFFLLLPSFAVLECVVAKAGILLSPSDHLLLALEALPVWFSLVALLAVLAAFLKKVLTVFLFIVGVYAALLIGHQLLENYRILSPVIVAQTPDQTRAAHWGTLGSHMIVLAAGLLCLGWRYTTRSYKIPLVIFIGGLLLTNVTRLIPPSAAYWIQPVQVPPSIPLPPDQLNHLTLQVTPAPAQPFPVSIKHTGVPLPHSFYLNQTATVAGLEAPYFVQTVQYHAKVTLRSGKTFTAAFPFWEHRSNPDTIPFDLEAWLTGAHGSKPGNPNISCQLHPLLSENISMSEDLTGATIKGEMMFNIRRAFVAHTLPLQTGAFWRGIRSCYKITSVRRNGTSMLVTTSYNKLLLPLRGDRDEQQLDFQQPLLVHRPTNQVFMLNSGQTSGAASYVTTSYLCSYTFDPTSQTPLPSDWPSDTEMVFFDSEDCGWITRTYELHDVTVSTFY